MNILKRRQLEKLSQENTKRKAAKHENALAKDEAKPVSKLRQNLEKKQAKKSAKPADQLASELDSKVEIAKDELAADLENQVEGVKDDLAEGLESQAGELSEVSEKLDKSLGELGDDLGSVQDDVVDLENRADGHDDDIQDLKSKLDEGESTGNPELETHKAIVEDCLKNMSSLDDIDERLPYKAEASKRLEAFVTGYIQSGAKYPNSVAVRFMIWLFDLGDIAQAVPLALHLSAQNIHKMPKGFKSSLQTFACDETYKWAADQLKLKKSAGPYLDDVVKALEAEKWELPKLVNGMMYMMRAKHFEAMGEDKAALADYEKAMSINSRAGAAKIIPKLKAKLGLE